ncbi:MAG: SWIM zinc finger family protein, partial [Desertifilum sp. SIO1I2]|nr:SWIM zinc finger family protein [Desertifilum sp. SIO1I2]
ASYEVFKNINEFACGTTNIDYSAALYDEFQKIRSYKTTQFQVDPSGFEVQTTHEETFKEVKIDLPESWVRGFLQVSSAMSLPAIRFDLHPMDIYNLCLILRRHKEKKGPRSLRYHLTPGQPIKIVFEPWDIELTCPRSPYLGSDEQMIRVWGRRRLHILERLIPITQKFTVHLLGTGMPSFYVADLGDMSFTLGLSGWTANDWSQAGNFDLMAPRVDVDSYTQQRVFEALRETWRETADSLADRLNLSRTAVLGALGAYTQAGRAIYDLNKQVYRLRELSREPLPMERLRFANEREEKATRFLSQNAVTVTSATSDTAGNIALQGTVRENNREYNPALTCDRDERMIQAECTCNWHQQNKLYKGPCEHILALRMQHARQCR